MKIGQKFRKYDSIAAVAGMGLAAWLAVNRNRVVDVNQLPFGPEITWNTIVAHPDDEIAIAGALQRTSDKSKLILITNGDGLAKNAGLSQEKYGLSRSRESMAGLTALGKPADYVSALDFSEVEIYDQLRRVSKGGKDKEEALGKFIAIRDRVYAEIKKNHPDKILTTDLEGGHPEHDLANIIANNVRKKIEKEEDRKIGLYTFPLYLPGLPLSMPFRFRPFKGKEVHELRLSPEEVDKKINVLDKYPSQKNLIARFTHVLNALGRVAGLVGNKKDYRDFARTEVFEELRGEVDYSKRPNALESLCYFRDGINYKTMLAPIAAHLDAN